MYRPPPGRAVRASMDRRRSGGDGEGGDYKSLARAGGQASGGFSPARSGTACANVDSGLSLELRTPGTTMATHHTKDQCDAALPGGRWSRATLPSREAAQPLLADFRAAMSAAGYPDEDVFGMAL